MATFLEMYNVMNNVTMQKRTESALCIAAFDLLKAGSATKEQRWWARSVLHNPQAEAIKTWRYIIAKNDEASQAQMEGVADRGAISIQSQIETIVPELVKAMSKL